jgi:alkylhydroperoxidase/carboxymuconolactone decarboxylase family protein YurZ
MRDVYRRNSNPSHKAVGGAAGKSGLLGARVNELIALAVAVTVRGDGCITVYRQRNPRRRLP